MYNSHPYSPIIFVVSTLWPCVLSFFTFSLFFCFILQLLVSGGNDRNLTQRAYQSASQDPCGIVLCSMISPRRHDSEGSVQGVVFWTPQRALIIWVELWVCSWQTAEKHQCTWALVYTSCVRFLTAGPDEQGWEARSVVYRDAAPHPSWQLYSSGGGQCLATLWYIHIRKKWE